MVSANGLVHGSKKTKELLISHPGERPLSAQIFGADPEIMREAAQMVEDQSADLLDVNLGCSVRKVTRQGAGVALMRQPEKLEAVLKAVRRGTRLPLTVKMRTGWDPSGEEAVRAARIAVDCGADAVVIHPRTATQGFSGRADWTLISLLKDKVSVPVIGNGDIEVPGDADRMRRETGCDGVMIGRASIGNPWIFTQVIDFMDSRPPRRPDLGERLNTILRYINYSVNHFGESRAVAMMRSRLGWFVKGLPESSQFRGEIIRLKTRQEMVDAVCAYFDNVKGIGLSGAGSVRRDGGA
jgi:nifR3 family TIM-barrel protein